MRTEDLKKLEAAMPGLAPECLKSPVLGFCVLKESFVPAAILAGNSDTNDDGG